MTDTYEHPFSDREETQHITDTHAEFDREEFRTNPGDTLRPDNDTIGYEDHKGTPIVGSHDVMPRNREVLLKARTGRYGDIDPSSIHPRAKEVNPVRNYHPIVTDSKSSLLSNFLDRGKDKAATASDKLKIAAGAGAVILVGAVLLSTCRGDNEANDSSLSPSVETVPEDEPTYTLIESVPLMPMQVLHADGITATRIECGLAVVSKENFLLNVGSDPVSHFLNINSEAFAAIEPEIKGERVRQILDYVASSLGVGEDGRLRAVDSQGNVVAQYSSPVLSRGFDDSLVTDSNQTIIEVLCNKQA
jgi:hypothetical protein